MSPPIIAVRIDYLDGLDQLDPGDVAFDADGDPLPFDRVVDYLATAPRGFWIRTTATDAQPEDEEWKQRDGNEYDSLCWVPYHAILRASNVYGPEP